MSQYSKGSVSGEQVQQRGAGLGFVIMPQTDPPYPWDVKWRGGVCRG